MRLDPRRSLEYRSMLSEGHFVEDVLQLIRPFVSSRLHAEQQTDWVQWAPNPFARKSPGHL